MADTIMASKGWDPGLRMCHQSSREILPQVYFPESKTNESNQGYFCATLRFRTASPAGFEWQNISWIPHLQGL